MAQSQINTIRVMRLHHRNSECLALHFPYDEGLIKLAKKLGGRWSRTHSCWYIPQEQTTISHIINEFKGNAWVDARSVYGGRAPKIKAIAAPKPKSKANLKKTISPPPEYENLLIQTGYSKNTISAYVSLFGGFINYPQFRKTNKPSFSGSLKLLI